MDRYIDAEKAINSVDTSVINSQYAISIIKSAPTEDVVPVVHARWIPQSRLKHILYYLQTGQDLCSCSNCTSCGNKLMRRCPTCMAKMDEEVEE